MEERDIQQTEGAYDSENINAQYRNPKNSTASCTGANRFNTIKINSESELTGCIAETAII